MSDMKFIYDLLEQIKVTTEAWEVSFSLFDLEEDDSGVKEEQMQVIIYTDLLEDPLCTTIALDKIDVIDIDLLLTEISYLLDKSSTYFHTGNNVTH